MDEEMLDHIEVALLAVLLKGGVAGRDLVKAGFRPDLMPSPIGRDLARLALRVRDARGDVSEDVAAQISEMPSLGSEGSRLLALAGGAPCPDRAHALAYLAALELEESRRRFHATEAKIQELLGPTPEVGGSRRGSSSPPAAGRTLRRVRLPEPGEPRPGSPPGPRKPGHD